MSKLAPIHIISGYSLLRSGLTMERIEKAVKSNDYFGYGLTDEYVMSGLPPFVHLCEKEKKPYVLGMSLVIDDNYLVVYAKNDDGYQSLINLSLAHQKEELTFDFLKSHSNGLIGVLETNYGYFKDTFSSLEKIDTSFTKYLLDISKIFSDDFYLGIEVTSREEISFAKKIRKFADQYTYECVALPRVRYLKKDDAIVLDIVDAIDKGEHLEKKSEVGQEYFFNEIDYHKIYSEKEIDNTNKIINSSQLEFFKNRGSMLHFGNGNSDDLLKNMTYTSLNKLGLNNKQNYIDRLEYELNIIKTMGYSDYFLLVQDYVNWAKDNGIVVGAGRGSAAGSLVSYLLNINEVDPLLYNLQFERFLNPNRTSMPDIDVDFMDTRRDEVVQYMRDKYGNHRVSNIVAYQSIGAKQALRDIGRVYEIPETDISMLCKSLKDDKLTLGQNYRVSEPFKKLCEDEYLRGIVSLAGKIEGLPRQSSLHAAGILLNNIDMENAMPISIDLNDNYVSQYEGKYLEEQGFLKMDFLGIRNLTTIDYCLKLINARHPNLNLDPYHIPFDTKEVFELIRSGQVIGLFQIETPVMKKGIQIIKPTCFDDVVALLALNRPGPMQFMTSYAKRRDGKEKVTYLSEDLKDILSPTYGIIVYQEQINLIAVKIAGMTRGEADLFRRAISKKDKKVLESQKGIFIKGCISKGYNEKVALSIFDHIAKFADYGFNKSHSVAYAMITCRMAYLKANYPLEFYAAVLQVGSTSETKFGEYISELRNRKMRILSPNINKSTFVFEIEENGLLFPLSSIKGLNTLCISNILHEREKGEFTDFFNFVSRMYPYKINENQILALINSGSFDNLYHSRASMRLTVKSALQYAELNYSDDGQMNLGISAIAPPSMNIDEDKPMDNLDYEYEALGIMLSSNPLDYKKEQLDKLNVKSINEANRYQTVKIAGVIKDIRRIKTKKGDQMAIMKIYDQTGDLDITIFPKTYDVVKGYLVKNSIVIVTGKFDNRREEESFIADNIEKLED